VLLAVNLRLHAACSYTPHLNTHTHTQAPTHRLPIPAWHLLTLAPQDLDDDCGEVAETKSRYVVAELPVRLPVLRPALDKPNPKLGVGEWWLTDTGPAVAGAWLAATLPARLSAVYVAGRLTHRPSPVTSMQLYSASSDDTTSSAGRAEQAGRQVGVAGRQRRQGKLRFRAEYTHRLACQPP
jgi:hypothetical protein